MKRICFILLLLLCQITQAFDCSKNKIGINDYYLRVGSRQIQVIGWQHFDPINGQDRLVELLNEIALIENKTCEIIESKIDKIISEFKENIVNSENVVSSLQQTQTKFVIDKLGTEHSTVTQKQIDVVNQSYLVFYRAIRDNCSHLNNKVDKIELLIPGPLSFYKRNYSPNSEIEGVESHYLKNKLNFNFDWIKLRPDWTLYPSEVIAEIEGFDDSFSKGDIDRVLKKIKDQDLRKNLEVYLLAVRSFAQNSISRSYAIGSNVYHRTGNYVVLIGSFHAKDIADWIYNRCNEDNY